MKFSKAAEIIIKGTINCGTGMIAWNFAKKFVPPTAHPVAKVLYFAGVFGISQMIMDITSKCIEQDIADMKATFSSVTMEQKRANIELALIKAKKKVDSDEEKEFIDVLSDIIKHINDPKDMNKLFNILKSEDIEAFADYMADCGYDIVQDGNGGYYYKMK